MSPSAPRVYVCGPTCLVHTSASSAVGRPCGTSHLGPMAVLLPASPRVAFDRRGWAARYLDAPVAHDLRALRRPQSARDVCNPGRAMLQQIMRAAGLPGRASAHSTNSCCAASMHGAHAWTQQRASPVPGYRLRWTRVRRSFAFYTRAE